MAIPINPIDLSGMTAMAGARTSYLNLPTEVADISKYYEPMFEVAKAKQQIQGALEGQRMQTQGSMQLADLQAGHQSRQAEMQQRFTAGQNDQDRMLQQLQLEASKQHNEGMLGARLQELEQQGIFNQGKLNLDARGQDLELMRNKNADKYQQGLLDVAQKSQGLDREKMEKSFELELFKTFTDKNDKEADRKIKMLGGLASAYKSAVDQFPDREEEIRKTYLSGAVKSGYMSQEEADQLAQASPAEANYRATAITYTAGMASDFNKSKGSNGMSQAAVDKQNERHVAAEKGANLVIEKLRSHTNPKTPDVFGATGLADVAVGSAQSVLNQQGDSADRRRVSEELYNDYDELATYRAQSRNVPPTARNIKTYKDEIPGKGQILSKADFVPAFINEYKEFASNLPEDHPDRKNPVEWAYNGEVVRKSDIEQLQKFRPKLYPTYEDALKAVKQSKTK